MISQKKTCLQYVKTGFHAKKFKVSQHYNNYIILPQTSFRTNL